MTMKIKAIAPWFGGKRSMAQTIVDQIGRHRVYWGLCCGSLAVEMVKPPCVMETVVDLHGDLTNLARVLAKPHLRRKLHQGLVWSLMSDGVFEDAAREIKNTDNRSTNDAALEDILDDPRSPLQPALGQAEDAPQRDPALDEIPVSDAGAAAREEKEGAGGSSSGPALAENPVDVVPGSQAALDQMPRILAAAQSEPNVERAMDYLLVVWLGRNGVAGSDSYNLGYCIRYTANGGHAATRWKAVREAIPAWGERLANMTILQRDIFDVIPRIEDKKGTVIYIDPPYLVKGAKYEHDFRPIQHVKLARALGRFKKTRVVVSYYENHQLREWYDGWTFIDCARTKSLGNQGKRDQKGKATKAPEILIVNGPEYT